MKGSSGPLPAGSRRSQDCSRGCSWRSWRVLRLVIAQRCWLCGWTPLVMALALAAMPAGLAWLARAHVLTAQQLVTGLLHCDERYLPLWALVAGGVVWSDAEAEHRPLLFAWPVRSWELALAKVAAVGLSYALLAGAAALSLAAALAWATGEPFPSGLPLGLLLVRSLLPAALLLALAAIGGALGSPWMGLALGAALWFPNLLDPTALWLDRHTGGVLNLFAWTRGSVVPLEQANLRQALAALGLCAVALGAPGVARRGLQRRFGW